MKICLELACHLKNEENECENKGENSDENELDLIISELLKAYSTKS